MSIVPHLPQNGSTAPVPPPLTVADLVARYEVDYLPQKAAATGTQNRYIYPLIRAELGSLPLAALTPPRLRQWRDSLLTRFRPTTARRYLSILSAVLTTAVEEYEVLAENPLRKIRWPSEGPGRVRWLQVEERERLLTACLASRTPALYPVVLLALSTGARKNEICRLRWEQVDVGRGLLRLEHTKNGERRSIPVVGLALEVLRTWEAYQRGRSAWVFPRQDGQAPNGQNIQNSFSPMAIDLGQLQQEVLYEDA
jgi:integrase